MKVIIGKCDCDASTNGGSCKAKKIQGTRSYETCEFAGCTEWKEECKDKSTEETIKFLQDEIMNLGFFKMNSCIKRIKTKWRNHDENEERISRIRKKVNKKIDKINREIKALTEKKGKKNKFSPQLK